MKLYVNPQIDIKEFSDEKIVTNSAVPTAVQNAAKGLNERGATKFIYLNEALEFTF